MLTLKTPPALFSGSNDFVQSVCDHLRLYADIEAGSSPADLDHIKTLIDTAAAMVDGPAGMIGRALLTQSYELKMDGFCSDIVLPITPVREVESIVYIDTAGAEVTMDESSYRLFGAQTWNPELCPAYGTSWPDTRDDRHVVTVTISAGYGDVEDVPAPILQAIRLITAHLYVERQPVTFSTPTELPMSVRQLLAPYRIWR